MPGRTGSGIAAGDRLAGAWGSRFCLARPARVRRAKLGGPQSLTRFALAHGTMGRLRESLGFRLRLTWGDQHDRPRPGRSRGKKTQKAPPGETGRGWVWEVQSPFRLRGRVQMRE